ncbi:MAG: protoporphyrinogen oxidase [Gemmatimonadota bacterium]|nr:protoporphyrinogen oxidase [Gemmatimonadota bacterium]
MRVGIVGGGITGLALGHALTRAGIDWRLFERSGRPGGVIRSRTIEGRVFELGAQRTRMVEPVRRLVSALGLDDRVVEARPGLRLHILARGTLRAVPTAPGALLRADLLTVTGRLRVALEPLTGGLRPDETVAGYFRRKAGDEAYRCLFGPLISATFASDPAAMPARHALPMILEPLGVRRSLLAAARRWTPAGAVACTFREGMEELTGALARRYADRIALSSAVVAVAPAEGGLRLELESGVDEVFDRAVLTTPAPTAARLLSGCAPVAADRLARLTYNEVVVVGLAADVPHEGFGFQTALGSSWRTRGVTWSGSVFGRRGVCAAYLGGGLDPEIARWSDDEVAACAAREFEEIHGVSAEPMAVARPSLPAYDSSWDGLAGPDLPQGLSLLVNYMGRLGISARIAQADAWAESLAREISAE